MWSYLRGSDSSIHHYHHCLRDCIKAIYSKIPPQRALQDGQWSQRFRKELDSFYVFGRIRKLAHMSSLGARLALSAVLFLGRQSFPERIERPTEFRGRDLDTEIDELMVEVALNAREEHPEFLPTGVFKSIESEISFLSKHGIFRYYERSYKLLLSWTLESSRFDVQKASTDIRLRIQRAAAGVEERLKRFIDDNKIPSYDWFGESLKESLDEIRQLSDMPKGLPNAIELLIWNIGKWTYNMSHGIGPLYSWSREAIKIKRVLDPLADELLVELLTRAREDDSNYFPTMEFEELKTCTADLMDVDIPPFFPKSYALLCSLEPSDDSSQVSFNSA